MTDVPAARDAPHAGHGRLIAFEGVDGAGKSTALALVAERLRARGARVFLPRLGKHHSSKSVRAIRDLTRDRRHLDLDPRAELLLYCAREAQILAELVVPELRQGKIVLIDRSLLTPVVLGRARGLAVEECERAAALAAGGVRPDLTLVFDVDPRTSRLRKRLERVRTHSIEQSGRKGLAGSALKERVRNLYSAIAEEQGHPVLHAERASPTELAARALHLIEHGADAGTGEDRSDRVPVWRVAADLELEAALESLPLPVALLLSEGLICARELRRRAYEQEPALCAYALDAEDPLRASLAAHEPAYALRGCARRPLSTADDLRLQLLERFPDACIAALRAVDDPRGDALRERHSEQCPDAVLESLAGREDAHAEQLRWRCFAQASDTARADGLVGCQSERAWAERDALFERDPLLGLTSLRFVTGARANAWLERFAELAPKPVLDALAGRSDTSANRLRERLFATGPEAIDSARGLDDEAAWALRERALRQWPSTVVHSLLGLEAQPRAQALIARCRAIGAGDVHQLRRLAQLQERRLLPAWAAAQPRLRRANAPLDR